MLTYILAITNITNRGQFILQIQAIWLPLNIKLPQQYQFIITINSMYNSFKNKFRQGVDIGYAYFQKYLLEHIKYNTVKFNTKYRHRRSTQYLRTAVGVTLTSYAIFNLAEIENLDRFIYPEFFKTEYSKLVEEVRSDKNDHQVKKAINDLIKKGQETSLTSLQLLALSEIIKKPELNLHAEYIASLK